MNTVPSRQQLNRQYLNRQQGTVLIIALLVVTVITGIAVNFTSDFQISMKRGEQRLYAGQMMQYWLGIESFALWGLKQDKEEDFNNHGNNAKYDHLAEAWSTTTADAPIDGGYARGTLVDAQGRFNLNQLAAPLLKKNGTFAQKYAPQHKRFIRLLQTQDNNPLSVSEAEEITQAVMDWIDPDDIVTGIGGAENGFYSSKDHPHRAANQLITSVSELRLIKGITDEIYEHLLPLVIALPDKDAGININTALPAVLQSLNAPALEIPLDKLDVTTLMASLPTKEKNPNPSAPPSPKQGYKNPGDFFSSSDAQAVFGTDDTLWPPEEGLATGSNYFLLKAEVALVSLKRKAFSLLKRDRDKKGSIRIQVVRRGNNDVF